jgi:hypothetical protein
LGQTATVTGFGLVTLAEIAKPLEKLLEET